MQPRYAGLIDAPSGALLMLSADRYIVAFLTMCTPDTFASWGVNYPNYLSEPFPLAGMGPETYPKFTWRGPLRRFIPTPPELLTDRLWHTSALATKKAYALFEMVLVISNARALLHSGVLMQESVHLTKRAQAEQYRAEGFPETDRLRYPYVLQYAGVLGVPMKEAALEILFKAQLDDEVLARTEATRLKFFGKLKTATLDTIAALMTEFRGEMG